MPDRQLPLLLFLLVLTTTAPANDERDKKIATQRQAASDAWNAVDAGDSATAETKHLIIQAPKSMEQRLKTIGGLLEKYHDQAIEALRVKSETAYPGKISVFLFPRREHLTSFARRVEKRRPNAGETGSFSADDDRLLAAASPGMGVGKNAPAVEAIAGEQIAELLLMRRAGARTAVPDWLVQGFGRATSYRVQPKEKFVQEDRKLTRLLVRKRSASEVWDGELEKEEVDCLQGSLVEMLAYGPGSNRFGKLLDGYKPEENVLTRTTAQAMETAGISPDKVARMWKAFVK